MLASSGAWAGLSQNLSPQTIAPGQRATFTIRLDYADLDGVDLANEDSIPELMDDAFEKTAGVPLLDRSYERTKTDFVWKYSFTAYIPGTFRIPAVEIRFGAQTFSTTAQTFTVQAGRLEGDDELRPEFDEEKIQTKVNQSALWSILGILAAAAAAYAFHKRRKQAPAAADTNSFETPEVWLKSALERLRQTHAQLPTEQAIGEFGQVLRTYLGKRYLAPTDAMTLRELIATVRDWERREGGASDEIGGDITGDIDRLLLKMEGVLFNRAGGKPELVGSAIDSTERRWLPVVSPSDIPGDESAPEGPEKLR